nr:hypothetical protein [Tanacetum cinerariifolium]
MTDLNAQLTSVKPHNDNLVDQVASFGLQEKLSNYENLTEQLEDFQDAQLKVVNDKFDKFYVDFVALHLEEWFYPHLFTIIFGRRWLLTHGMELAITKCLHFPEYLSSLGVAIGKAIKKGMQDGLSTGITHGAEGRVLTNVAAYNPSAEADYISALQHLQNVNFSLLVELRSNNDASVDTLMVPIHHSPGQVVVGASNLSLALDVSIFPASVIIVSPISVDDYEVSDTNDQVGVDGNANPIPNMDDSELNIPL